jgi:hypothetical protein
MYKYNSTRQVIIRSRILDVFQARRNVFEWIIFFYLAHLRNDVILSYMFPLNFRRFLRLGGTLDTPWHMLEVDCELSEENSEIDSRWMKNKIGAEAHQSFRILNPAQLTKSWKHIGMN